MTETVLSTEACVKDIGQHLKNRLEWLDSISFLSRKDATGFIMSEKTWAGIDDKKGNMGYFRYGAQWDHEYSKPTRVLTSAPNYEVTANLRLVFLYRCKNDDQLERSLWNELMLAPFRNGAPEYRVVVTRSSKDTNEIYIDETNSEEGIINDNFSLMAFELKVSYKVVMNTDPNCIPTCDEC